MSSSKPHVTRPTLMLVAACLAAFTTPVPASVAFAGPATERIPEAAADREEPADPTAPLAAGAPETAPGLATLRAQQTEARGKLIAAQVRVRTAERTAEEADRLLAHADRARDQAAATLERARRNLTGLAVGTYKTTRATGLRTVLASADSTDLTERIGYLSRLSHSEREALERWLAARHTAREAARRAEEAGRAREEARAQLAEAEAAAEAAEKAVEAAAALLAGKTADRSGPQADRKPDQAAARAEPPAVLLMPVQGWQSSPFGMRHDPYYGVWQLHAGMDIAAPGGTPIRAARDGTVVRADWNGGYGNFTCLRHDRYQGKQLVTCYAHQSVILVSPGQKVRRGDVIGRVGTTGASTGDHLHFEVRLDGEPVDPAPMLPKCLC